MLASCLTRRPFTAARGPTAPWNYAVRPKARVAVMAGVALQGKQVVVTGASQGLGLEFTKQLLDKGNTVVAAVRNPSAGLLQLEQAAPEGRLHVTQLDVSSTASITRWAGGLRDNCRGLRHVDVLINNAGVYGSKVDLKTVTEQDMIACFKVNTIGPLVVVQQLLAAGLIGGFGGKTLIANVSSKVGSVDDNRGGGGYPYRASKSALNIVNKSMSIDLAGDGVTCVLLHPGYVRTNMTGGQGLIDVQESVAGMLGVLESSKPLNGEWYDFKGEKIPW
uniref:Short-chain dehydrogenase/reductase SDR n=1 Tax=Tetradesmus obliquus TaxID=3088 RepID=A0A383VPJ6_TETOB|eukprot:jgi/Sobl393_1/14685/SZX67101.1